MAFKLITEEETLTVEQLIIVLFGMPGVAKTSLSFTSDNPILMDFDEGVHRSVGRKNVVKFSNWEDVKDFTSSGEIERLQTKTLIADTGGAMLDDFIALQAIKQDQRNGKKGGGVSLQGFGAVKEIFNQFIVELKRKKVDLVIICHAAEHKDGDNVKLRPKMTGGSYDIMLAKADLVGYMETFNDLSTLEFAPTDRHVGKNSAEFPKITLPHYSTPEWPGFLARIIAGAKDKMNAMSDAQRAALQAVKEYEDQLLSVTDFTEFAELEERLNGIAPIYKLQVQAKLVEKFTAIWKAEFIDTAASVDEFNDLVARANNLDKIYQRPVKEALIAVAAERGLTANKETKKFEGEIKPVAKAEPEKQPDTPAAGKEATEPAQEQPKPAETKPAAKANRAAEAKAVAESIPGVQKASSLPTLPKVPKQPNGSTAEIQVPGDGLFPAQPATNTATA